MELTMGASCFEGGIPIHVPPCSENALHDPFDPRLLSRDHHIHILGRPLYRVVCGR